MTLPSDPRSIVFAHRIYRVLLAAYPRRFRKEYQSEMALLFLDCCREAYRAGGRRGLPGVSGRALLDLMKNVPEEHVVQLTAGETLVEPTRSCSGCYSEVQPDWRSCKICGTYLHDATTHETHFSPTYREEIATGGFQGVNRPLSFRDPDGVGPQSRK
jgi:hypothetical protein